MMFRRAGARWVVLGLAWLGAPQPAPAQYRFLGELRSYQRVPSGVTLRCVPAMELQLQFLTPTMVRVTLRRPGYDEPLLVHALECQ